MKKILLILFIATSSIFTLGIIVLFFFWNTVAEIGIQSALNSVIGKSGIRWKNVSVSGTTARIGEISGFIPVPTGRTGIRLPIPFELRDFSVGLPLYSILTLKPSLNFGINGYGGTLKGDVISLLGDKTVNIDLAHIKLSEHPIFQSLGIQSGSLDLLMHGIAIPQLTAGNTLPFSGTFEIKVSDLSAPQIVGAPSFVKIPPIENGQIYIRGETAAEKNSLPEYSFVSNLGKISGHLECQDRGNQEAAPCLGEGTVSLSKDGIESFGQWLPIISNNRLTASNTTFSFILEGRQRNLPLCVKVGPYCFTAQVKGQRNGAVAENPL